MQESTLNIGYEFEAIGTQWYIGTADVLPDMLKERLQKRINDYDQVYSRFRSDSLITTIAKAHEGGTFRFPEDALQLFSLYDDLFEITLGAIDPLIGSELELLGYDSQYSLQADSNAKYFNADKPLPGWRKDVVREKNDVMTQYPLTIDIGAAGKGYLVDILCEMLGEEGIDEYVIDGGGDIRHAGRTEYIIGLEHPVNAEMVIGTVPLKNGSVCASATNKRKWGDGLHYILNARTGKPVTDILATWVLAETALLADGLASALFFADEKKLKEKFNFSSIRLFSDMHIEFSDNFSGTLFTR